MTARSRGTSSRRLAASASTPCVSVSVLQTTTSGEAAASSRLRPSRHACNVAGAESISTAGGNAVPRQFARQAFAAAQAARIVDRHYAKTLAALAEQMTRHFAADLFVREPDDHVDRFVGEVPDFDDWNIRLRQPLDRCLRMTRAGQHDAVRSAPEQCFDQRPFARLRIRGQSKQRLVAEAQRARRGLDSGRGGSGNPWLSWPRRCAHATAAISCRCS